MKVSLEHSYIHIHIFYAYAYFHTVLQSWIAVRPPYGTCLSPGHLQEMFADPWLKENF